MEAWTPAPGGWHSTHAVPCDAVYGESHLQKLQSRHPPCLFWWAASEACVIPDTKGRFEHGFPIVSLQTLPPLTPGKKTLERKLAEVWFQSSHWIYILHGRRNVSINLSVVSSLDVLQDTGPLANISISHIHRVVNLFFSSCSLRIGAESATEQCSLQPGIWQLFVSDYS